VSALKVRVHTQSGSIYLFDREAMTWKRMNNNRGHEDILFFKGVNDGLLTEWVDPIVGSSLIVRIALPGEPNNWIRTTPVVLVEDVS